MRALRLVGIEPLAIIAAHALRKDDARSSNGAPLARLLTDAARRTLVPSLDAENGELRDQTERGAKRAQKPTVSVTDEDRKNQQRRQHRPEHGRLAGGGMA